MTASHEAWSSMFQSTGSECFHLNHSIVSQKLSVLTHMWSEAIAFLSIGTLVKSQNCLTHQSKSDELEQKSPPEQAGGSTRVYGLQILCWLSAVPLENRMFSLDLITSSENHLHWTQQEGEQDLYGQQTSSASHHTSQYCKGHPEKNHYTHFQGIRKAVWPWLAYKR